MTSICCFPIQKKYSVALRLSAIPRLKATWVQTAERAELIMELLKQDTSSTLVEISCSSSKSQPRAALQPAKKHLTYTYELQAFSPYALLCLTFGILRQKKSRKIERVEITSSDCYSVDKDRL